MNKLTYIEGIFFSKWFSKFINSCFRLKKKIVVEKFLYQAFFILKKRLNFSCLFFFFETLEKVKPVIGLKVFTVGKNKAKAIPTFLHVGLQYKKAILWLISGIFNQKQNTICENIYTEFYATLIRGTSETLKKKKDHYKYTILFKSIKRFK